MGPFAFLDNTLDGEASEKVPLTKKEQADMYWSVFVAIVKAAHYKTTVGIDNLPLLPAMMSLDNEYGDSDGYKSYFWFPKCVAQFAARMHPHGIANKDDTSQQFALHKAVANSKRALDNDAIMELFGTVISLIKIPDAESGLYPFMLAAASSSDFFREEQAIEDRVVKANAARAQIMEDQRGKVLAKFRAQSGDQEDDDAFEDFLFQWVMDTGLCDDLMNDLYAEEADFRFETDSEQCNHEMKEKAAIQSFDLSFRLLRELPEVLQLATTPNVEMTERSAQDNKTRKSFQGGRPEGSKKPRTMLV